jgi:hypothetical protein
VNGFKDAIANDRHLAEDGVVRCDAWSCRESHPLEHDDLGEPSFGTGRWLGWLYVDLNRTDLLDRPLRFCSVSCCVWWMERESVTYGGRTTTPLDEALRAPSDELKRKRALAATQRPAAHVQNPSRTGKP